MIELYSTNVAVTVNTEIPFNNVALKKGDYVTLSGAATLQFNHCGVYELDCHGVVTGTGDIVIEVTKDNVILPQTVMTITGADPVLTPFAFKTLIQVSRNNGPKCCQSPVEVKIMNAGVEATYDLIDVSVTKVC